MKKVLLLGASPEFVGELQANHARHCEILSTHDIDTAYSLLKTGAIELLLIQLNNNYGLNLEQLKKFLKKINRRKFKQLTRILIAANGGDYQIEPLLKLGVSAV
ncbi:MAG TPA: hypothetical protein ENN22_09230, partial [bacterium]|nr:hypothetical protein [bacterium]